MSSNYTGNPTGTQSPSPQPGVFVDPIVNLPSDGDDLNAASVAQAYKALADSCAYSASGYREYPSAATTDNNVGYAEHLGLVRSGVDYNGYIIEPPLNLSENWIVDRINSSSIVSGTSLVGSSFSYTNNSTNGTIDTAAIINTFHALPARYPVPRIGLKLSSTGVNTNRISLASRDYICVATAASTVVAWFDIGVSSLGNNITASCGLSSSTVAGVVNGADACIVYAQPALTNWFVRTIDDNASTDIDTGVPIAADQMMRVKIVLSGSSTAPGHKCWVFINNVQVASSTTNLPRETAGGGFMYFSLGLALSGSASADSFVSLGPVQVKSNGLDAAAF